MPQIHLFNSQISLNTCLSISSRSDIHSSTSSYLYCIRISIRLCGKYPLFDQLYLQYPHFDQFMCKITTFQTVYVQISAFRPVCSQYPYFDQFPLTVSTVDQFIFTVSTFRLDIVDSIHISTSLCAKYPHFDQFMFTISASRPVSTNIQNHQPFGIPTTRISTTLHNTIVNLLLQRYSYSKANVTLICRKTWTRTNETK